MQEFCDELNAQIKDLRKEARGVEAKSDELTNEAQSVEWKLEDLTADEDAPMQELQELQELHNELTEQLTYLRAKGLKLESDIDQLTDNGDEHTLAFAAEHDLAVDRGDGFYASVRCSSWFGMDEEGVEIEVTGVNSAQEAAQYYVDTGDYGDYYGDVRVMVYRKEFYIQYAGDDKMEVASDKQDEVWRVASVQKALAAVSGFFAMLVNPKTKELVRAVATGRKVTLLRGEEEVGEGYLDSSQTISLRKEECPRTHTPQGVAKRGMGFGLLVYCALALLAASSLGRSCVGSTLPRSDDANRWWKNAVRRGLAIKCEDRDILPVENVVALGIVVFWDAPGEHDATYNSRRREMRQAFLLSRTVDKSEEEWLRSELAEIGASAENIYLARGAQSAQELRANRARSSSRLQKIEEVAEEQLSWAAEFAV